MAIGAGDIRELFAAELDLLRDRELADKVVRCWVEAAALGHWHSREELERMPFTLLVDCQGIGFIAHTKAVTWGALGLARALLQVYGEANPIPIDLDHLVAGGLLHDVTKLVEIEPDGAGGVRRSRQGMFFRHPISGAMLAGRVGLPDPVVHAIAVHAREGEGSHQTIEAILIHQADFAAFNPLKLDSQGKLIR